MAQSELAIHVPVEVLATQLDITDLLAKAATIEELFKTAFIPTDRHSEYARWIDELRILKHCGRAIGPRDVGKSRSSVHYPILRTPFEKKNGGSEQKKQFIA